MSIYKNNSGFSVVELTVVVAVVGVLGAVGFTVYDRQQNKKVDVATQTTQNSQANNDDIPSAPIINSTADLAKAEQTLDDASSEGSKDSAQLDAEIAAF